MNSGKSNLKDTCTVDLFWGGPYQWPNIRQKSPLDKVSGVYMLTVESEGGYLIYGVGITTRPVRQRFNEHRRAMLTGKYTLFDLSFLRLGIRKEIWHGYGRATTQMNARVNSAIDGRS